MAAKPYTEKPEQQFNVILEVVMVLVNIVIFIFGLAFDNKSQEDKELFGWLLISLCGIVFLVF